MQINLEKNSAKWYRKLQKQPEEVLYKKSKACSFIKQRLQHRCFPENIAKFLRTPILKNNCQPTVAYEFNDRWFKG